ncbi:alpha/beta hydrolase family protein [Rhodococcus sp. SMB37]|uniref:alpha/beta hydrolase n=1 Tax=Rhodococcus sp. SMB37 TaxID=2512213 RepID=UPI00104D47A5|nr:alpha/beta hydrolase [Rhodococcus sp. SMB37]TCN56049.1 alpha/beta hydrolase family protein [Rhodococcus sp. SMB37]
MDLHDLAGWNPDALEELGAHLGDRAEELDRIAGDIRRAAMFGGAWTGDAADAAAVSLRMLVDTLDVQADSYRRVSACAAMVAPKLRAVRAELAAAHTWADEHGLVIGVDGTLTDAPGRIGPEPDTDRSALRARLDSVLRRAQELDHEAASMLARTFPDESVVSATQFVHTSMRFPAMGPFPDPASDPGAVAAWWNSLGPFDRTVLLTEHPERIGGLDGIPSDVRDLANRALLGIERERLEGVVLQLQEELESNVFGGLLSNADAGLEQTLNKLAALDAIDRTLTLDDRRLLALDMSGREAMAAVAVGDIDTADHIAVYTPGAGSTVQGNLHGYDQQVSALRDEAQRELGRVDRGSETVAAVTWMNYQAPHFGWGLAFTERSPVSDLSATLGAPRLATFLDGLDASRPDSPPHVTAIGHSYGAFVTSLALQQGAEADKAVFVGAAGLGTSDVGSLGVAPGSMYLIEADGDFIADTGIFGGDPSHLPGLTHLSSDAGEDVSGVQRTASEGHSSYLVPGSMSTYNIAVVVADTADERSVR